DVPANGDRPAATPAPGGGKRAAIDHAVDELGVESFASLEIGQMFGQYAFYAIDKPRVRSGALVDVGTGLTGDFLLNAIDQAAERPDMRVLDGSFSDPEMV